MKKWISFALSLISLAALVVFPHFVENPYALHICILLFLNITLGLAWNLIGGYAGQYSIGHSVFFGLGAYTTLIFLTKYNIPPWYGIWIGVVLAVLLALFVGAICFRLRGPYFVLASIAVAEIFHIVAMNTPEITNGGQGILTSDLPPLKIGSFLVTDFASKIPFYYIGFALALLSLVVTFWVDGSKLGYYLQAIREDQDAAESLGIHLRLYKNLALILSAMLTGLAGAFSAIYVGFIDPPTVLSLDLSISIVLICIIGGVGTIYGPVVGAVIVVALSEILRSNWIPQLLFSSGLVSVQSATGAFLNEQVSHAHVLIYGILVVVVILFMPQGVLGFAKKLFRTQKASGAVKSPTAQKGSL